MNRLLEIIRRDRLYLLLLIFVILVNVASTVSPRPKARTVKTAAHTAKPAAAAQTPVSKAEMDARQQRVEKLFNENRSLALTFSLTILLFIVLFLLGLVIDAIVAASRLRHGPIDISTYKPGVIRWSLWDVAKVGILFLFFGYMAVFIEAALLRVFPVLKSVNFRMVLNSSLLDILVIVFTIYFTVGQYKEKLAALGISLKNFSKNIFYGVAGYIALLPALAALMVLMLVLMGLFKYTPQKQAVVELFLKEKDTSFLLYTSLFASVVGPVIEELFFRGFLYSAMKKHIGVLASILVTGVIFSVLHAHVAGFLPIMALGMFLAYMYEKTGTLVAPITIHITHNLSMVFFVFLIRQLGV